MTIRQEIEHLIAEAKRIRELREQMIEELAEIERTCEDGGKV